MHGGKGITSEIAIEGKSAAEALIQFVNRAFDTHLPRALSQEIPVSDFYLKLKPTENNFSSKLITIFQSIDFKLINSVFNNNNLGLDFLNDSFGHFLADSFRDEKELGQYLTPTEVVSYMVEVGLTSLSKSDLSVLLNPDECKNFGLILDPSCGVGSFLTEIHKSLYRNVREEFGEEKSRDWSKNMLSTVLVGIDKSERMLKLALTNLALLGSESINLHIANALSKSGRDGKLTEDLRGKVKLILTNPPFGAEISGLELMEYKLASEWNSRTLKSADSELLFLERYVDWLAPGGTLVSIVPDSVLTNRGLYEDLRKALADKIELKSITSLPSVTFGAAGTTTKTSVLHFVKRANGKKNKPVYYAICDDIGFDVIKRQKIYSSDNQLKNILPELQGEVSKISIGRFIKNTTEEARWDANFHISLPQAEAARINSHKEYDIYVKNLASLSSAKINPGRTLSSTHFEYIEISDVNPNTLEVTSKKVSCSEAPSRARKPVRRGQVLVSTVRPERRVVGIVPPELDGAVCSTGFAVLNCPNVEPTVLARLLQTNFVNNQILRNNIGIAYPAINEDCLLNVLLPITKVELEKLEIPARNLRQKREELTLQEKKLSSEINDRISEWANLELT